MTDFSHLRKITPTDESEAEYVFDRVVIGYADDGSEIYPSIWFRPMVEGNAIYINERVRLAIEKAEKAQKETKADRKKREGVYDQLEADREDDRLLMARCCALRWGVPMTEADGKPAGELDEAMALQFFRALPIHLLDPCRGWVQNPFNFYDRDALVPDAAKLGNS